jgi:NAD(P)-dependent dehydrogenase (short-subunit alcohol dehydrogenase family)
MNLELHGKRVLITGGSKGIGLACAESFIREGAHVMIVSRSDENLVNARHSLPSVMTYRADVGDAEEAERMVEAVEREFGPIDILVNSAGAAQRTPVEQLTPAAWRAAMDAKYFTYINVIDPMIKRMAARGAGVIANVAGIGGRVPTPVHLAGSAANAALMLATTGLAAAYGRRGVRVVAVNPSSVATERLRGRLQADAQHGGVTVEEALRRMTELNPTGRLAEPREVAEVIVFLASSRAAYVSGVNLSIDGAAYPCL